MARDLARASTGYDPRAARLRGAQHGLRPLPPVRQRATTTCAPTTQAIGVTLDGGFAEYMRIPAAAVRQGNLMPIAEAVDPAVAALIEPFACVLRGQNALRIRPARWCW